MRHARSGVASTTGAAQVLGRVLPEGKKERFSSLRSPAGRRKTKQEQSCEELSLLRTQMRKTNHIRQPGQGVQRSEIEELETGPTQMKSWRPAPHKGTSLCNPGSLLGLSQSNHKFSRMAAPPPNPTRAHQQMGPSWSHVVAPATGRSVKIRNVGWLRTCSKTTRGCPRQGIE